jgi:hypothetical protein
MLEHMFESMPLRTRGDSPVHAWVWDEPRPGDPGYEAYVAYEAQQIAFWSAYGASDAPPEDALPNLNGARTDEGLLGEVARQARRANAADGAKLRAVADYALRKMANPEIGYDQEYMKRSVEAEIALELRLSPSGASELIGLALMLVRRLPKTMDTLQRGEITARAAEVIADESANLDVAQCAVLEDKVLPDAGQRSCQSLRNKTRREVEKLDADAVRQRAQRAREERTLYVKDGHDGMATLCLYAPAGVARSIFDAINDRVLGAQTAQKSAAAEAGLVVPARDDRSIGAQRHDTIVDLLATALGIDPWGPPVPVSSFLSESQIAALDRNAGTYVPSRAMKDAVRRRDRHCRFPGCHRPARQCDLDHTVPFVKIGGRLVGPGTVYTNLGALCRFHHQIKAMPGWHLEQDDRGRFIWTTPHGIRFVVHPPPDDDAGPPDFAPAPEPTDDDVPF